jgi:hypothetical protein
MAIDTSKAFGQSYMEGFGETFDPQQSPFQQTGLDLARNIERVQLLEKQRQAEMTDMYGRVKMPSGTQMYGNDFAKAKEMTELLTSEATLEKHAESPEMQREYAALVNKANQFIADATAYYKATYGNGDPKTGTYSGSVSRMAIDGFYESQGYEDARKDYDEVFESLDAVSYNTGSLRIEGNDFVFDDDMGTSSISDVNFQNIDVFQPQLQQSRFTSSAEAFSKLPGVKGAKSRSQAKEASMAYLQSDAIRERDAYNEYKQIDPEVATFEVAMTDAATREKILESYADAMAANWKAPKLNTTPDTEEEIPPIPTATRADNGMVMVTSEGTVGSANKLQLAKTTYSRQRVDAIRFARVNNNDMIFLTLSNYSTPVMIDLNSDADSEDRRRLSEYLDSVYGSGASTEILSRLRAQATASRQRSTPRPTASQAQVDQAVDAAMDLGNSPVVTPDENPSEPDYRNL